jgi:hypothetical protein
MKHHPTSIRMDLTNKRESSKCWWGCAEICTSYCSGHSHCGKQYGRSWDRQKESSRSSSGIEKQGPEQKLMHPCSQQPKSGSHQASMDGQTIWSITEREDHSNTCYMDGHWDHSAQRNKPTEQHCMIPLMGVPRVTIIVTESRVGFARGWGRREGDRVSVWRWMVSMAT